MDDWFWSWLRSLWEGYNAISTDIVPLLAPLATFVTGLLTVAVGSIVAWAALRQARTATRQAEIARLRHEEQTKADQQRRITESFTKAVEQLGSDKIPVPLGGIYTLERLSRESELDYWPIMETLSAFVREQAPWKGEEMTLSEAFEIIHQDEAEKPSPPMDVQAVLSVINRRDPKSRDREQIEKRKLDLRSTDLRGAFLVNAHLEGALLNRAHLEGAFLIDAHLEEAVLKKTHLQGAILKGAHLQGAYLKGAHLEGAYLGDAHLEGADLTKAHLDRAFFMGAFLRGTHLEGVDTQEVLGLTQEQLNEAHGNAETKLPEGLTRPAHWLSEQDGN